VRTGFASKLLADCMHLRRWRNERQLAASILLPLQQINLLQSPKVGLHTIGTRPDRTVEILAISIGRQTFYDQVSSSHDNGPSNGLQMSQFGAKP